MYRTHDAPACPSYALTETARLVELEGRKCVPVVVDLLDREALKDAFDKVKRDLGFIEILHNNAGGSLRKENRPFAESSPDQWDYFIGLNLRVAADCIREVVAEMIERRCGRTMH
jgi:NADP-dependent 3-hydroxy acid dehydrogenase YdfG